MSRLTTHVLDLVAGRPAAGVRVSVGRFESGTLVRLAEAVTNRDGRIDGPLVDGAAFTAGLYEIAFHVGAYFDPAGTRTGPRFLDVVPLRFGVDDPSVHYHVPLLVTPWSYSTYRGS